MTAKTKKTDAPAFVEPKDFEDALARLQSLVESLEAGDVSLESSVQAFEEGQKLVLFCQHKLKAAETSLKQLIDQAAPDSREDEE
ncbi:MAG: exodeoxyribonuclease VII small subunit [Calditrichaeota bacterium]|nr:exodeoxyribonuclease VII small subunit [Calditrichota bacterium]MCB9391640.1 exodeoxyribonuclease VII small subunit [Calditrichota bacterium]